MRYLQNIDCKQRLFGREVRVDHFHFLCISEKFVKSLDDFYISYPRPKIYKDNRFYGVKWHDSFFKFPQEFYVKLIIFGKKQTLYLKQNVNLQPSEFNVEDKWTNKASVNNDHEKRRCYYTGTIIEQKNSRIAVSTCHGLVGIPQILIT